jgi:hypothetical protein
MNFGGTTQIFWNLGDCWTPKEYAIAVSAADETFFIIYKLPLVSIDYLLHTYESGEAIPVMRMNFN